MTLPVLPVDPVQTFKFMANLSKDHFFKLLDATLDFSIDFLENGTTTRAGSPQDDNASYSIKINDLRYLG